MIKCLLSCRYVCVQFRPSDRGESPSYSSLNHSYETLNMSETGDTAPVVVQNTDNNSNGNVPRMPHRPAPPIPTPKYKMTAGIHKTIN